MRPQTAIAVGLVIGSALAAPSAGGEVTAADVDCSDFGTQAAAQHYFDRHGPGDPAGLDADGNGIACESNPCPCSTGDGGDGGDGGQGDPAGHDLRSRARVSDVTDGDTLGVMLHGRPQDVRLIGIDTPEVYFGEECGGSQASSPNCYRRAALPPFTLPLAA